MIPLWLFWSSLLFVPAVYGGYPLFLLLLSKITALPPKKEARNHFFVSVVLAARNEEQTLRKRLSNLVAQDYQHDQLEIIVVSDGSTDNTEQLTRDFIAALAPQQPQITLVRQSPGQGKPSALNTGVAAARGEIIIFADCRQKFAPNTISQLTANFTDPGVGAVSGELILLEEEHSEIAAEMGSYWNYEKFIRQLESRTGSVVGATGAVYAIRKELFAPLPAATILDDVLTPLNIAAQGYRVIFDSTCLAYDSISLDMRAEWQRKVRTLAGNWQLFSLRPALFSPCANPLWGRLLWHKIFRLFVPLALLLLLGSNLLLLASPWYGAFFLVQLAGYLAAGAGFLFPALRRVRLINASFFVAMLNLAVLAGLWHWLRGRCTALWKTS